MARPAGTANAGVIAGRSATAAEVAFAAATTTWSGIGARVPVQPLPADGPNPLASPPVPPFGPEPLPPATLLEYVMVGLPLPLEQPESIPPALAEVLPKTASVVPLVVITELSSLEASPGITIPATVITGTGPTLGLPPGSGCGLFAPPGPTRPAHVE